MSGFSKYGDGESFFVPTNVEEVVASAPSAPMIPQLLSDGWCPGRVFRNLRAVLGRMPSKRELGLRWWQTVELAMTQDEMVVVNTVARRLSRLLRGQR